MTDEEVWRLKVHAFLHDPPEKALVLFEGGHAARGQELAERLVGPAPEGAETAIREADHLASAADREKFLSGAPDLRWSNKPVLRHPLSGDAIDLGQWGWLGVEPDKARAEVDHAVKQLLDALDGGRAATPERTFWALWRLLPEYLAEDEEGRDRMGILWEYLPAETRMPDHSIWDHQRLVSALAPILWQKQAPALLLVSFGPVQGFIGTARRTADLWAGSFILSWLASRAILPLAQAFGPDAVLFPALWRQPLLDQWLQKEPFQLRIPGARESGREASLPNRFLAVVPQDKAKESADKCVAALHGAWKKLGRNACQEFAKYTTDDIAALFDRQIPAHLEAYWAAFPWPSDLNRCKDILEARLGSLPSISKIDLDGVREYRPNAGGLYGAAYRAVDLSLGGAKACRVFESDEEPGLKCSLCGQREVIHPFNRPSMKDCKDWWKHLPDSQGLRIKKGEALCAVCLVKRLGSEILRDELNSVHGVPSTSEIAAASFKLAVLQPKAFSHLKKEIQKLVEAAQEAQCLDAWTVSKVWRATTMLPDAEDQALAKSFARIDGECFWATTEPEQELEEIRVSPEMAEAARNLVREAEREPLNIAPPFQYLALLRMDGDDMGKWLGGGQPLLLDQTLHPDTGAWLRGLFPANHRLWREQRRMTPATHAAISRACNAFALTVVPALVHEKLAYLIYAGGDDVLALVSLDDALELARDIRLAFGGHMEIENGRKETGFKKGRGFFWIREKLIQTFGKRAGLSGSYVVFHHKYPLQVAVEESRRAEEWAKSVKDKDALAIHIIRRSGQPTHCRIRWTNEDGSADPVHDLSEIARAVSAKVLSPRFFTILKGLLERPEAEQLPPEAIELLLKRELGRHWDNDQTEQAQLSQDTVQSAIWELRSQTPCREEWLAALEATVFLARGGR